MSEANREKFSEISSSKLYQSVVDRYFVKRYKIDVKQKLSEDLCILEHSNRICLVTLANSHPILTLGLKVTAINFQVDDRNNRLENKVSGKAKRGAQWINEVSALCHVTCDNGQVYTVCGCIKSSLIEVNESLISNPQLLNEKPHSDGYIAVLLTRQADHQKEMKKLLTEEEYKKALVDRDEKNSDHPLLHCDSKLEIDKSNFVNNDDNLPGTISVN